MTATQLASRVALIELVIALLTVAALYGSVFRRRLRGVRRDARRTAGHDIVSAALARGEFTTADLAALAELPRGDLASILAGYAPSLAGVDRERLAGAATRVGLMTFAASDIAHGAWWRRLRGARLLTLLGPTEGQLRILRRDPEATVRAEAAVAASLWPTRANVVAMVEALSDDSALVRFEAKDGLMRLGGMAQAAVLDALRAERGKASAVTLLAIASVVATPEFLDPAVRYSLSPLPEVRVGAVELLRAIGGADALHRLRELLADDDADVRRSAAQAVGTLGDWRAGRSLVPLLGDDDASVRLAAAIALTALGPPGMMLLRDAASATTPGNSASVARQVLDVAETLNVQAGV